MAAAYSFRSAESSQPLSGAKQAPTLLARAASALTTKAGAAALVALVVTVAVAASLAPRAGAAAGAQKYLYATAVLNNGTIQGTVSFTQADQAGAPTTVTVSVSGAGAAGQRGFHVHQNAGLANACADAGPHFNTLGKLHGAGGNSAPYGRPGDPTQRHVGDLGNVEVVGGAISVTFADTQVSLRPGDAFSIVNRAVVLHSSFDDLGRGTDPLTNTTGNAGGRVSCGTIVATLQGRQLRGAEAEGA